MKKPLLLVALCASLATFCAHAQYNSAASYPFEADSKTFSYISGGTDVSSYIATDEGMVNVPIGFTFNFAGTDYTSVTASSNGWLSFISPQNTGTHAYHLNGNSTHISKIAPALLPFWDNMEGKSPASASYVTTGSAPNRVFTFEWKEWGYHESSVTNSLSFQVILYENGGNNTVEYRYKQEANNPPTSGSTLGATIGIIKSASDYQTLDNSSSTATPSTTVYTGNIKTRPATDQSYYWGCSVNIATQPKDVLICASDNAEFEVSSGNATTYQWQVNTGSGYVDVTDNSTYNGSTTTTLEISSAGIGMNNNKYRCIVGTSSCSIYSDEATLSVNNTATAVTSDPPTTKSVCETYGTTITVAAAGGDLSYQWQVNTGSGYTDMSNTAPYSDVDKATLKISAATLSMNGYKYRCVVGGICAPFSVTSGECEITVNPVPTIAGQPVGRVVCATDNTSFSVTSADATGYQWQVDAGSGFTDITNNSVYGGATTNTLAITSAGTSMDGYKYRCILKNTNCAVASSVATLTVHNTPTSITSNPPSAASVCEAADITMSLAAAGGNLTYQWQVEDGTGYVNLTDVAPYSDVTTPVLKISSTPLSINGYKYRCVVSGTCAPVSVTSNECTLTVNALPINIDAPANSAICAGDNTTFTASSTGAATYQWQIDDGSGFVDLAANTYHSNVTSTTLNINTAIASMDGNKYRMISISGAGCSVEGSSAELTVNTAPSITNQPSDLAACDGKKATFTVEATGTALTYQWQENTGSGFTDIVDGGIYSDATTNKLKINPVDATLSGYEYRCKISGTCTPDVISNFATLTVNPLPIITASPADDAICEGSSTTFTAAATGASTYQWQLDKGSGFTDLSNNTTYSNVTTTTLGVANAPRTFTGYVYRMVATTGAGCSAITNIGTLTINTPPDITTQPSDKVVCEGEQVKFSTSVTGSGLTYQWQENTGSGFTNVVDAGIYSGATTNTLKISSADISMNGYEYRCLVSGTCSPNANTNVVLLTVNPLPVITASPTNAAICDGNNTNFSATATGAATYQWQLNSGSGYSDLSDNTTYSGSTATTLNITGASLSMDGYKYRIVVNSSAGCKVNSSEATLTIYKLPAVTSSPSDVSVCENDGTSFSVSATGTAVTYQWQVNTGSGYTNVSNGGVYSNATTSTLVLSSIPANMDGYKFRCQVGGTCSPVVTSNNATLTVNTAPVVTTQPVDVTICAGASATFTTAASGDGLIYQWQEMSGSIFVDLSNNGNYSGVNTPTLKLNNTTTVQDGYHYRCKVTGTCLPEDFSAPALLTVNAFTKITKDPPAKTSTCELTDAAIEVISEGSNLTYQWQENNGGGYVDINNGPNYSGANDKELIVIAPPATLTGFKYRCKVNGVCGSQDLSTVSELKVNYVPEISTQPKDVTVEEHKPATFKIVASGTALNYQWQVNDGTTGWTDLFDNFSYDGTKSAILKVNGTYMAKDGYKYRCLALGVCPADTSDVVTLTVKPMPTNSVANLNGNVNGMSLYPNPVSGSEIILQIEHPDTKEVVIRVTDQLGKTISESKTILTTDNTATVDVSGLPSGIYTMHVSNTSNQVQNTLRFTKY